MVAVAGTVSSYRNSCTASSSVLQLNRMKASSLQAVVGVLPVPADPPSMVSPISTWYVRPGSMKSGTTKER